MSSHGFLEGCASATLRPDNKRESAVCQQWGVPSTFIFPNSFINLKKLYSNLLLPWRKEFSLSPKWLWEKYLKFCVCLSLGGGGPFLLNICQMWVAGLPKSEGLASSFLKLFLCLLLKSVREWTTSPGCHVRQLVCAKHTLCLCSGLWPACPSGVCLPECSRTCSPLLFLLPLAYQWDIAPFPTYGQLH